jgi:outer membrane receptor for ferrienterochelin and colicins
MIRADPHFGVRHPRLPHHSMTFEAPLLRRALSRAASMALLGGAAGLALAQPLAAEPAPTGATAPDPAPALPAGAGLAPAPGSAASPPASAPATPPTRPAPSAPTPPNRPGAVTPLLPRVQIQGGRLSDTEERRQSTAAKIVIGREEIDRFGDSSLGEVLRRLPGVSVPGPAGRGGAPRLRGLGGGFTQFLIDGQRAPMGFSIEDLSPEQVERIEIIRAPTAETGARAIGGTINIITREGFRIRLNDLRLGFESTRGRISPGLAWTWNQPMDDLIVNVSASVFQRRQVFSSDTRTTDFDVATGDVVREQVSASHNEELRNGLNLTSRLQWRRENGNVLLLTPSLFHIQGHNDRSLRRDLLSGADPTGSSTQTLYTTADADSRNRFTNARLNGQWRQRFDDGVRAELSGGGGRWQARFGTLRREFDAAGAPLRTFDDDGLVNEQTLNLTGKLSKLIEGNHSVVIGSEVEASRRQEERTNLQDGVLQLADFGSNLEASSQRLALYGQNEWELTPHWSAYAGLRWEGITTRGTSFDGTQPVNRSSVTTPLLHALWKPVAGGRDQVRFSLTRSYRSPTLQNLVARPRLARGVDLDATNDPTNPDAIGNAALKPELATGIDIGIERYLPEGGVISATIFSRRLKNVIRTVTGATAEPVSWSKAERYVSRPLNIGGATTQGLELEARFRLDQLITDGPRTDVRTNLSLYRSRIDSVPGPDNRISGQPPGTLNVGADHRFRGTPLTMGGTVNWTPGYTTRVSGVQFGETGQRRQWDAYALWRFSPTLQLRITATNLLPLDDRSLDSLTGPTVREVARTVSDTATTLNLRLEVKL